MQYLIDGHNLIPKIPGLCLQDPEDEIKLVARLQEFARVEKASIEVYFDRAAPGFSGTRRIGSVKAHFVPGTTTADDRIINRIRSMGAAIRNYTIVTSYRRIQVEAKALKARVVPSEVFSRMMTEAFSCQPESNDSSVTISESEMDEWLALFSGKKHESG